MVHLLQELREEVRVIRAAMATKDDLAAMATKDDLAEIGADLRSEMKSLRADVASDLLSMERRMTEQGKRASEQIVGLRRAVMEYHSAVVGHGIQIGELEARVEKLEKA